MKAIKTIKLALASTLCISTLAVPAHAATTLKWATAAPEQSVWGMQLSNFAGKVNELSNGELIIEPYYGGVLGQDKDNIRQLQRGRLDAGSFTAAVLPTIAPETALISMPYVWSDMNEMACVLNSDFKDDFSATMNDKGIHLLGWSVIGAMGFSSIDPVSSPTDLQGQTIRSLPSKASTDFWKGIGAVPTTIAPSDISPALSTKRITAAEGSLVFYFTTGEHKIAPNWTQTNHAIVPGVMAVSDKVWNSLSSKEQTILNEAANSVALEWFIPVFEGFSNKLAGMLTDAGGNYTEAPAVLTDALRASAENSRDEAISDLGKNAEALWTKLDTAKGNCS